jgi:predicted metal-binding membrane protein
LARERAFLGWSAILFLASVAGTVHWCGSMAGGMGAMGMSASMGVPGATWVEAGAFMRMWVVMMVAMMLPTLAPALSRYRRHLRAPNGPHVDGLTAAAAAGYFLAWAVPGALGYLAGLAVAAAAIRWPALARAMPLLAGIGLLLAGCFQLSVWKDRELGRCRSTPGDWPALSSDPWGAWIYGLRLGAHCILCCLGYTVALFAAGVMDLRAMALVTAAITVERFAPRPKVAAVATGLLLLAAGGLAIGKAARII